MNKSILSNEKKFEQSVNIKRDFLKEISNYNKTIVFITISIFAGLVAYIYQNPIIINPFGYSLKISWIYFVVMGFFVVLWYESYYMWFIVYQYNLFKKEIEKEHVREFKFDNSLLYLFLSELFKRKSGKQKTNFKRFFSFKK